MGLDWIKYIAAVAVPVALIFAGGFISKLTRGGGWNRAHFYLGPEIALSSFAAGVIYLVELGLQPPTPAVLVTKMFSAAIYLTATFCVLLIIAGFHQDWEARTSNARGQKVVLVFVCNTLASALMIAFILFVKRLS